MDIKHILDHPLARKSPRTVAWLVRQAQRIPAVRELVERELDSTLEGLEDDVKPYREAFERHSRLPSEPKTREAILADMRAMSEREDERWRSGRVSGAVYHGDPEHIGFLNEVYALNSQVNPLHADVWPSANKFEAEIVAMTARMLGADEVDNREDPDHAICGTVSSGGTESIMLAMKAYRDRGREEAGIRKPNMVVPVSAHAAFDKASQYFGIEMVKVPIGPDYRADVAAAKDAIDKNTVVVVGSAPGFPHGIVDPIAELASIAYAKNVGFHTDACLGGFVLPFARQLGHEIPAFDFRVPGVTSISVDTHKYGYAAKGTSVVLYRGRRLRHHQYYTATEWPGGLYFSPTFAGSRPGALSAQCWAAMLSIGESGYVDATRRILEAGGAIKAGIASIPELELLGDPLWVIAFASESLDIYRVMEAMGERGWSLNGLHKPACVHIAVTLRHTQPGVAERFVEDLRESVEQVRGSEPSDEGMAPVYGLAANLPARGLVRDMLRRYMDMLYGV